ncbi:MAG: SPFH domain-containing protein [Planctomycetota bacterium]
MDIWKKLTGELIDIVEWLDNSSDRLVYRFERHNNEIKNGAKLVVRESQAAVFINEGSVADIFKIAGTYELRTQNLPLLATLQGWKYGFESPFKAEVYFVSLRQFTGCKWGTANPIMLRDPEFGPLRLRAFGSYAFRIADPTLFLKQIVGTNPRFDADGITDQLRNFIVSQFADVLGESKIAALDLAANYDEVGKFIKDKISPMVAEYGLEITAFLIENISLPPEVEKVLDQRTSMGMVGDMSKYMQFNAAQSMGNPNSGAGGAMGQTMGMGAGFALGQQMASSMANAPSAGSPPPLSAAHFFLAIEGKQAGPFDPATLKQLASQGKLTRETLAWKQGMSQWTPAGQIGELAASLGGSAPTPPPLP